MLSQGSVSKLAFLQLLRKAQAGESGHGSLQVMSEKLQVADEQVQVSQQFECQVLGTVIHACMPILCNYTKCFLRQGSGLRMRLASLPP